jgi:hypothetical protein
MNRALVGLCFLLLWPAQSAAENAEENVRFLRLSAGATTTECVFSVRRGDKGWSIRSVTQAGKSSLSLIVAYDLSDHLVAAEVAWTTGPLKKIAKVDVDNGKARVHRTGKGAQEFDVPAGVIVTSAPDWTDTFLLCRRFQHGKEAKQEFPGLWIHPEQKAQRLTFSIERTGMDAIEHQGKRVKLDRFLVRLRNNSGYAAWAENGRMIKLQPLQAGVTYALVREGYEKSAAKLRETTR